MRPVSLTALALCASLAMGAQESPDKRLDAICDATLDVSILYQRDRQLTVTTVSGAAILRTRLHDYALIGFPADTPLDAHLSARDGRTLEYVGPVVDGLALVRADRDALPLLANASDGAYAASMTLAREDARNCEKLGRAIQARADHALLPAEEDLAALCGSASTYQGPETGFLCTGDTRRWSFARLFDVVHFDSPDKMVPRVYLGAIFGDMTGEPLTPALGTPVYDLEGAANARIGFIVHTSDGTIVLTPAETVVQYVTGLIPGIDAKR